jgi:phosphoglycolate phosphatase-like HAD superfamily hydrolase
MQSKKLKFRCLIMDHDDTVSDSTALIHYPSFIEALRVLRPERASMTLAEFKAYIFDPGFLELCLDVLHFTPEERAFQFSIWQRYTQSHQPAFYRGMPALLRRFKDEGGLLTVVSHSESAQIRRDYARCCGFEPEMVFGWDDEQDRRKPHPYPVLEILRKYALRSDEALVVDDMKPGLLMAREAGVPFACAGWSHAIPTLEQYMRENSRWYFPTVRAFSAWLFGL